MSQRVIEIFDRSVVVPVLKHMAVVEPRLDSLAARQLLVGTAMAESGLRHQLQFPNGPARSVFQIEPETLRLIGVWLTNSQARHKFVPRLSALLPAWMLPLPLASHPRWDSLPQLLRGLADHVTFDDHLACALARLLYWSIPSPLPAPGDWVRQADYWKRHYNSPLGKGTPEAYLQRNAETIAYFESRKETPS